MRLSGSEDWVSGGCLQERLCSRKPGSSHLCPVLGTRAQPRAPRVPRFIEPLGDAALPRPSPRCLCYRARVGGNSEVPKRCALSGRCVFPAERS